MGAEAMFEAMGYKHAGDGILVLEGPVCPDRVAKVSQDSIVAFVECQVSFNLFYLIYMSTVEVRDIFVGKTIKYFNYKNERGSIL